MNTETPTPSVFGGGHPNKKLTYMIFQRKKGNFAKVLNGEIQECEFIQSDEDSIKEQQKLHI